MGADLTVNGIDEILGWVERTGSNVSKAVDPALTAGAEPILEELKRTSAYTDRSGKLRKSMKISKVKIRAGIKFIWIGDVDAEVPYSWIVERGSSKANPHPFMRPAFERRKDESYQIIRGKMQEAISE